MQLWRAILALLSAAQVVASESLWNQDNAWIRKYPCEPPRPPFPSHYNLTAPFWIGSIRGNWTTRGDASELQLGVLVVYNNTLWTCEDVDLTALERSVEFEFMGRSVGHGMNFSSQCPLPDSEGPNPAGNLRFSAYQVVYSFPGTHRLETLVSPIRFNRPNGTELDCGVVKITPDIGSSVSAALTYAPLGLLALVAVSSWRTNLQGLQVSSVLNHDSAFAGQGPLWATVLDVTGYLRHLQFIFVSASLSMEYPGFYVPAVGKLAWSCLLFWRGPFDSGYSHQGIDGGMYVSNASFGMQFMPQMLGYPNALNTLVNSLINLAILVVPTFFALTLLLLTVWQPTQVERSPSSILKKAAAITVGMALCFFSIPLLSYLSYDLFLVGFLPTYRIALASAMLLIIFGSYHFLAREIEYQIRIEPGPEDIDTTDYIRRIWAATVQSLPHLMPLLQAISVGSLQANPVAQVSVLATIEVVVLFNVAFKGTFVSIMMLCSAVRLLTVLMSAMFLLPPSEAARQALGYAMLALHAFVVLPCFLGYSCLRLYRSWRARDETTQGNLGNQNSGTSGFNNMFSMDNLLRPQNVANPHMDHGQELPRRPHGQSTDSFYRKPRSRAPTPMTPITPLTSMSSTTPTTSDTQPSSSADSSFELEPIPSVGERPFDMEALSEVLPGSGVDYSVREVDRYYGIPLEISSSTTGSTREVSSIAEQSEQSEPREPGMISQWINTLSTNLNLFPKKKTPEQEQGFSVVRPPRPPLQGGVDTRTAASQSSSQPTLLTSTQTNHLA